MSMHLEGPWLSTTGRRKGKFKWRSAEDKRRHDDLEKDWQDLKSRYQIEHEESKRKKGLQSASFVYSLKPPPGRATTDHIRSLDSGLGNASKKAPPVYTGDKIVGIGTMHKSNAVPIFSDAQAKEISTMRR
jgi:hypothetical protein